MTSRESRLPSLWLVLVPALLLAALGARAVVMEAERAETEARQRGRAAAGRLARSMETLLAEFEQALPDSENPLTVAQLLARSEFLSPVWLIGPDGALLRDRPTPPELSPRDAALVSDALARADAPEQPEGAQIAVHLLIGAAEVVEGDEARAHLLLRAAELDLLGDRRADAVRSLTDAFDAAGPHPGDAWTTRLITATYRLLEDEPRSLAEADWVLVLAERIASHDWSAPELVREPVLDQLVRATNPPVAARIEAMRRTWDLRREAARAEEAPRASVEGAAGRVVVTLQRRVKVRRPDDAGVIPAMLGGQVPAVTVQERLADEARALVAEGGILGVSLLAPDGVEVLRERADEPTAGPSALLEAAPLGPPLSGFRVVAEARRPSGPGGLALILAIAGLLTTGTLLWGAVALNRAARTQARLAEDRKRFLDHVAHEIRTPSTALLTLSEELASGHVAAEREPLYREHLLGEARRLADLVDDTLDLTRLEAGRLSFRSEPLDLTATLASAIEASRSRRRPAEGPDVALDVADGELIVSGDEAALRRTFRNLVDNAVAHGGGERPAEVRAQATRDTVTVTVRDHGRGIPAEHLPHLFERFYRVPEATHETKGVGLGLSLCHEVVTRHGGTITVESRPGEGTVFTVTLPRETSNGV